MAADGQDWARCEHRDNFKLLVVSLLYSVELSLSQGYLRARGFNPRGALQGREPLSEKSLGTVTSGTTFACSWPQQYAILARRAWLQTSRDKLPLIVTGIQV